MVIVHHICSHVLLPAHTLKPFELDELNTPSSPIPEVVVDLCHGNSTAIEPENIPCNSFMFILFEAYIHGDHLLDQLTHPIEDKGGESRWLYHVLLSNCVILMRHWHTSKGRHWLC
jgi:hypothetical protein